MPLERTLHDTPGVLPGFRHLVANLHFLSAANHGKRKVDLQKERDNEARDFLCCLARDCFSRKLFIGAVLLNLSCLNAFAICLVFQEEQQDNLDEKPDQT